MPARTREDLEKRLKEGPLSGIPHYIFQIKQNPDLYDYDCCRKIAGGPYTISTYDAFGNKTLSTFGERISLEPRFTYSDWGKCDNHPIFEQPSLISVVIDGKLIESCGDTLILEEKGLMPAIDFSTMQIPTSHGTGDNSSSMLINDFAEMFHGKRRVCVIKSQNGTLIKAYAGSITIGWHQTYGDSNFLRNTLRICIDGKRLYVHRANFQIIDTELL